MRFSILSIIMFFCGILSAQTTVSGNVSGTWTAANSPYLVTKNSGLTSSSK